MAEDSETTLIKVEDLIHLAMGPQNTNVVQFKTLEKVLYTLAKHMRVLGQKVEIPRNVMEPTGMVSQGPCQRPGQGLEQEMGLGPCQGWQGPEQGAWPGVEQLSLGPDGKPLTGPGGIALGPGGKPIIGPGGVALGVDGRPIIGPGGIVLGPDGRPIIAADKRSLGPDGTPATGPGGEALGLDGRPITGPDGVPLRPNGWPITDLIAPLGEMAYLGHFAPSKPSIFVAKSIDMGGWPGRNIKTRAHSGQGTREWHLLSSGAEVANKSMDKVRRSLGKDAKYRGQRIESGRRGDTGKPVRVGSVEVVTQQQFDQLEATVDALAARASVPPTPTLPDNEKLVEGIRAGTASLTETISTMQVTSRIQAAEKAIDNLADMLAQLLKGQLSDEQMEDKAKTAKRHQLLGPDGKPISAPSLISLGPDGEPITGLGGLPDGKPIRGPGGIGVGPGGVAIGPNGQLITGQSSLIIGPDGQPFRTETSWIAIGSDGKPLIGPDGEALGFFSKSITGPDGLAIGPDGRPVFVLSWEVFRPDGKLFVGPIIRPGEVALGPDGKAMTEPGGIALGPDGRAITGPVGMPLGLDGKSLTGPEGVAFGPDGRPITGPGGIVLGPDGKPLLGTGGEALGPGEMLLGLGPDGKALIGPGGLALGPDGKPLLGPDRVALGQDGRLITGPGGIALGPNGEPLIGPGGVALGPDGRPITGPGGIALGSDGKPITGPGGVALGPDGRPITGPGEIALGSDGKPLIGPDGRTITGSGGIALVSDGEPLIGSGGVALGPDERPITGTDGITLGSDGKPLIAPGKVALGPDGRPITGTDGIALDSDGKPLIGPGGAALGPDGRPITGPGGIALGSDGKPLIGSDGRPIIGPGGIVLGPDGEPLIGPDGLLLGSDFETLVRPGGVALGPDGGPIIGLDGTPSLPSVGRLLSLGDKPFNKAVGKAFDPYGNPFLEIDGVVLGPDGTPIIGPDGAPIIGPDEIALDPDGKPLVGPRGVAVGPDSGPITGPDGIALGLDGKPLIGPGEIKLGPDGKPIIGIGGTVLGPDDQPISGSSVIATAGKLLTGSDGILFDPNGRPIIGPDGIAFGSDGTPLTETAGVPLGLDGQPIVGPGDVLGLDGKPLIDADSAPFSPDGRAITGPDQLVLGPDGKSVSGIDDVDLLSDGKKNTGPVGAVLGADGRPREVALGSDGIPISGASGVVGPDGRLVSEPDGIGLDPESKQVAELGDVDVKTRLGREKPARPSAVPSHVRAKSIIGTNKEASGQDVKLISGKGGVAKRSDGRPMKRPDDSELGPVGMPDAKPKTGAGPPDDKPNIPCVTHGEMEEVLKRLHKEIMEYWNYILKMETSCVNVFSNKVMQIKNEMETALNLNHKLQHLQEMVKNYKGELGGFENGITTQLQSFSEQMTVLRFDLANTLAHVEEVCTKGETVAVMELTEQYENLELELEANVKAHQGLVGYQNQLTEDLKALVEAVELMREEKTDRDELLDGLRDKADMSRLTGLLTEREFEKAREDLEHRVETCYEKFRRQDEVLRSAIDEFTEISESKVNLQLLTTVRDEVQEELQDLHRKVQHLAEILEEPKAAVVIRQLAQHATCASCRALALMEPTEPPQPPPLRPLPPSRPRPEPAGAEDDVAVPEPCLRTLVLELTEGEELPAVGKQHVCRRWVGGSHTLVGARAGRGAVAREQAGASGLVSGARPVIHTLACGSDGKVYHTEQELAPCAECKQDPEEGLAPASKEGSELPGGVRGAGDALEVLQHVSLVDPQTAQRITVLGDRELRALGAAGPAERERRPGSERRRSTGQWFVTPAA